MLSSVSNSGVIWFTDSPHLSFSVVSWFSRSLITDTASVTGVLLQLVSHDIGQILIQLLMRVTGDIGGSLARAS